MLHLQTWIASIGTWSTRFNPIDLRQMKTSNTWTSTAMSWNFHVRACFPTPDNWNLNNSRKLSSAYYPRQEPHFKKISFFFIILPSVAVQDGNPRSRNSAPGLWNSDADTWERVCGLSHKSQSIVRKGGWLRLKTHIHIQNSRGK